MTARRWAIAGTLAAVAGGAAAYYWFERNTEQPAFRLVLRDGNFELRDYPELLVATAHGDGARQSALERGFERLAGYIFAKDRPAGPGHEDKIAMTAPVLQDADTDAGVGKWRTRFVMPARYTRGSLPAAPAGVAIEQIPARRLAAIRFSGKASDADLRRREDALRRWLERERLQPIGAFEYAFYNSPFIPPFLRRNEVLVPVAR